MFFASKRLLLNLILEEQSTTLEVNEGVIGAGPSWRVVLERIGECRGVCHSLSETVPVWLSDQRFARFTSWWRAVRDRISPAQLHFRGGIGVNWAVNAIGQCAWRN